MTQTYDAIVIGAGVMGASLAFHLAERGLKTAILERKVSASGATGHSSGLVRMHYDLAAESQLTFVSYKNYFSSWKERVGGECAIGCAPEKRIVLASVNEPVTSGLPSARQSLREFSSKSRLHFGHRLISRPQVIRCSSCNAKNTGPADLTLCEFIDSGRHGVARGRLKRSFAQGESIPLR